MNPDFKSYLKNSFKGFLWSLVFLFIICSLAKEKAIFGWIVVLDILGFVPGYYKYKDRLVYQNKLKDKGLTTEDIDNIKFVKDWEDIRQKGPIKYSLVDGGIFFGFAMCGLISISCAIIKRDLLTYFSESPSHLFNFIGYTYLAGSFVSIIIYRLLWNYKEQKFIRLTDPLH